MVPFSLAELDFVDFGVMAEKFGRGFDLLVIHLIREDVNIKSVI